MTDVPAARARGLPRAVHIREVGPRDGLQVEKPVAPSQRAALVLALATTGIVDIEAVSFVSPRAVPAMAGAAGVLAALVDLELPAAVTLTALVPNVRGAELALDSGMRKLSVTVSASDTYSERNVRMTTEQSINEAALVCAIASRDDAPVDAVLSCAFGSPYEGDISPGEVKKLCDRLRSSGAASVTLADTTGMATPRIVGEVLSTVGTDVGMHLHDTRGTALLNLYTALGAGVTRFDTAIGGLGGSPFAHGAGGNVATEDVVALLDDLGVSTGIDLGELLGVSRQVEEMVGHPVPSRVAHAGPRTRLSDVSEPEPGTRP